MTVLITFFLGAAALAVWRRFSTKGRLSALGRELDRKVDELKRMTGE